MTRSFFRIIKSSTFQLTALFIAAVYITLHLWQQYEHTAYLEKAPRLLQASEKIKKLATPVTVGLHINSFPDFSFSSNNFTIDAILWFRFAKSTESLDTINKFTFKSSKLLEDGSLCFKTPPIIKILDQDVLVSYHIQANFMASLNFKLFPTDDHRLNFIMENKSVTANELIFVTEPQNITLSEDILVQNWLPRNPLASAGYIQANLKPQEPNLSETYPCVAFSVDFENIGARLPISLYFPLFILFFIMMISLMISISDSNRIALVAAGVPALVLFRLVIDSVSPQVGYVTNIDMAYYLVASLSLLICFLQAYIFLALQKSEDLSEDVKQQLSKKLENLNAIMFAAILILLVLFLRFCTF